MSQMNFKIHCREAVSQCYHTYRFFFPFILEWKPTDNTFYVLPGGQSNAKYWPGMFNAFGIGVGVGVSACIFTVINGSRFEIENVMCVTMVLNMALSVFGGVAVMLWQPENVVLAFNRMKILMGRMELFCRCYHQNQKPIGDQHDPFRRINLFLNYTIKLALLISLFLPPTGVIADLDPYINVYNYYIRSHICHGESSCPLPDWIAFVVRLILGYFNMVEGCRGFITLTATLFLWLEFQTKYIECLKNINNKQFFVWYFRYQICLRTFEAVLFEWIRILMGTFFSVIVVVNVIIVKFILPGRVPLYVAWAFPIIGFAYFATVYFLFPFIMSSHEDTAELLQNRRFNLYTNLESQYSLKFQRKKLKCLRPISMKCGNSFILKKETKCSFYDAVVGRTIDGILLDS